MKFPKKLRYTREHEWVLIEGNQATIGITDFAQHELGDVVFVELPKPGTRVSQGKEFGVIESVKSASDLFSPVTGEVIELNGDLADHPELVNESPYERGWMLRVNADDPAELDSLLDASAYRQLIGT
jgi:glycine cleavage system H protein